MTVVMNRVVSGAVEKWVLADFKTNLTRPFIIFLQIFAIVDDFLNGACQRHRKTVEKSTILPKKMKKSLV